MEKGKSRKRTKEEVRDERKEEIMPNIIRQVSNVSCK